MALAETAKLAVELNLSGNYKAAIGEAQRSFAHLNANVSAQSGQIGRGFQTLGRGLVTASVRGAVIAGVAVAGLTRIVGSWVIAGQQAQKQQLILDNALRNSGRVSEEYIKRLDAQSKALLELTGVDDEAVKSAQAVLVRFGLTGAQIEKLTPLVLDLSKATGRDLNASAIAVGKSATGTTTALQRMGINIDKTAAKTDAFGTTFDALTVKVGGTSRVLGATFTGRMDVLREKLRNVEEAAGIRLAPALTHLADIAGTRLLPAFSNFADRVLPVAERAINGLSSALESGDLDRTFTKIGDSISKIPWGSLIQGMEIAGRTAKVIVDAFLSLPKEVQSIVIAGFAVNKLSGGLVGSGIGQIGGGILGALRGSTPANPLFVKDVGLGGAGGAGGLGIAGIIKIAAGAALAFGGSQLINAGVQQGGPLGAAQGALGGAAMIGGGALAFGPIGAVLGSILGVVQTQQAQSQQNSQIAQGLQETTNKYLAQQPTKDQLLSSLAAVDQGIADITSNPLNTLVQGDALDKLKGMRTDIANQLANSNIGVIQGEHAGQTNAEALAETKALNQNVRTLRVPLDALHKQFHADLAELVKANKPQDVAAIATRLAASVLKGVGSAEGTRGIIAELRKKREVALAAKDYTALRVIDAAIRKVEAKLPNREWVARQLAEAKRTADSSASTKSKIDTLTAIQRTLRDRGDIHAANLIRNKINELKGTTARAGHDAAAAANRAAAAIRAKKLAFINNTTVNVSTYVSPATIRHVTTTYNRYGTQVE